MKRIKYNSLLILLFLSQYALASNSDSLKNVLSQQRGAERLPTLLRLCPYEFKGLVPTEAAQAYAQEIIRLAEPLRDSTAIAKACLCLVVNQDNTSEAAETPQYLARAQSLAVHRPDLIVDILFRWSNYYSDLGKEDAASQAINQAIQVAEKQGLRAKRAFLLSISAKINSGKGRNAVADSLSKLALALCQNSVDSADVLGSWAGVQKDFGKPEAAANAFLTAYQLSLKNKNYVLAAFTLNQYATILRDEGKTASAIQYLEEVVRLSKDIGYNTTLASAYNSLGVLYQKNGEDEKALTYYELAFSLKKSIGRPRKILTTARNLAELYWKTGKYAACLDFCQTYIPLSIELKNAEIQSDLAFLAAMSAAKTGKKAQAVQFLNMGEMSINQMKVREEMPEAYQFAAKTHALLGNFDKAYTYQLRFQSLQDSIFDVQKSRAIAELETRYATQKKEQQIAVLAKDNQLKQTQQYAFIGGLLLLSVLALLLWRNSRNRQRHNDVLAQTNGELTQKNNEIEILLREIHHRVKNNLQIISSLLRVQARRVVDEGAVDALRTGQARVRSMAMLHERLYQGDALKNIPMRSYLSDLVQSLLAVYKTDEDRLKIHENFADITLDIDTAVPLGLIANELITNILKYAFPDNQQGDIYLTLSKEATYFKLSVADNGIGIPLSIDGKPVAKRTSFGLELVDSLTKKLNGELIFKNEKGTLIELTIPIH